MKAWFYELVFLILRRLEDSSNPEGQGHFVDLIVSLFQKLTPPFFRGIRIFVFVGFAYLL